jgi:hypothetical protein
MTTEQLRRARVFTRLLEAKHALEALEQLLHHPDDKRWAAQLADQVRDKKLELQRRLGIRD